MRGAHSEKRFSMQMVPVLLLLIFVSACSESASTDDTDTESQGITETASPSLDPDADGFTEADGDCAPEDGTIYPGATEFCDGVDNNCDGTVDEAEAVDGDPPAFEDALADDRSPGDHS